MKTLRLLATAIALLAAAVSCNAQITRATFPVQTDGTTSGYVTNSLAVPSGEVWELLQITGTKGYLAIVIDDVVEINFAVAPFSEPPPWSGLHYLSSSFPIAPDLRKPIVVGPASIEIATSTSIGKTNYQQSLVYRRIFNQPTPPAIPSNTVVIPTDAAGPVQIILESSQDLVNWTAAEPGTYGASTEKRFFRLRAVVMSSP